MEDFPRSISLFSRLLDSHVLTFFLNISAIIWCVRGRSIFDIFYSHFVFTRTFTIFQFLGYYINLFFCKGFYQAARRTFFVGTLIIYLKYFSKDIGDFIRLRFFCVQHVTISIIYNQFLFCFLSL